MKKTVFLGMAIGVLIGLLLLATGVFADGTETLGPPSISIEHGSGLAVGGAGMVAGFGTIEIDVPAGATVEQVILYWSGEFVQMDDDTIWIDGHDVDGDLIGGPTLFFSTQRGDVWASTYRADVTSLGLVTAGHNSIPVSDLEFDWRSQGAGLMVVYQEPGEGADIVFMDGSDLAYLPFDAPLDTTVPQVFPFASSDKDREADLTMMVGSVGGADRPNALRVTIDGNTTTINDPFFGVDGPQWDTLTVPVDIPAGVSSIEVQVLSREDGDKNPASLNWIVGALSVPLPPTAVTLASFAVNPIDGVVLFAFGLAALLLVLSLVVWFSREGK